jgi:molecular chaperone GrpE
MAEEENNKSKQKEPTRAAEEHAQLPEPTEAELLQSKVAELENSVNQFKDQFLRKAAEFENYKKRIESDYSMMIKFSTEGLITELLPVLDDFERSMKAGQNAKESNNVAVNEEAFAKGMELIYNKLKKFMAAQGVKTFESLGKPFDPYYHDALLQVSRKDVSPHTVIEEVEKGYTLHEKVIRHARVIVSAEESVSEEPVQPNDASDGTQAN